MKRNRHVILKIGLSARRDPAFHAVRFSNHSVLDVVHAVAPRVGAPLDLGLDKRKIVWVHAGPPQIVVDRRARRQTPHYLQRVVPLQLVGLWIPRVAAQLYEINGDLGGDAQRKTGCMCDANGHVGTFLGVDTSHPLFEQAIAGDARSATARFFLFAQCPTYSMTLPLSNWDFEPFEGSR